jgi:hypothetical protein
MDKPKIKFKFKWNNNVGIIYFSLTSLLFLCIGVLSMETGMRGTGQISLALSLVFILIAGLHGFCQLLGKDFVEQFITGKPKTTVEDEVVNSESHV